MALGGPFEDLNAPVDTGAIPDMGSAGVAEGLASLDPNAVSADPTQGTRPAMQNPTDPQQMGGGWKPSISAPNYGGQRLTNSDFGADAKPYNIAVDGHQFSQPSFQMPAAVVGARLQALSAEDAQLKQAQAALVAPETRPKIDPRYTRSYTAMVNKAQQDYINSIAEQYGGDQNKAWKALAKRDPNNPGAHEGWARLNRDMNDLGDVINYKVKAAEEYQDQVDRGILQYDEAAYNEAAKLQKDFSTLGQGGYGDVQQLLRSAENYDKATTLPFYLSAKGKDGSSIDDHVKTFMERTFRDAAGNSTLKVDKSKKGFTVLTWEDMKKADSMIDALADDLYPQFKDVFADKDAFKERLHEWYPVQTELHVQAKANPQPKSKSKDKDSPDKLTLGLDTITDEFAVESKDVQQPFTPNTKPSTTLSGDRQKVRVLRIRNTDGSDFAKPVTLNDGNGDSTITMYPKYIQEDPRSGFYLVGLSAEESETETSTTAEGEQTKASSGPGNVATDKATTTATSKKAKKGLVRVPITGNEENVSMILRGKDWKSYFGGQSSDKGAYDLEYDPATGTFK